MAATLVEVARVRPILFSTVVVDSGGRVLQVPWNNRKSDAYSNIYVSTVWFIPPFQVVSGGLSWSYRDISSRASDVPHGSNARLP